MNLSVLSGNRNDDLLDLNKDDLLDLSKAAPKLKKAILAADWDPTKEGASADLDLSAFLLEEDGRVHRIPDDVIYFKHMVAPGIELLKDNLTGEKEEDEDDGERIILELTKIPDRIKRIVFFVTIYEADIKKQTFGMIRNSCVRLLDAKNGEREIARYQLKEEFSAETAITFAELIRDDDGWQFHTIGEGHIANLNQLLSRYR